MPVPLCAAEIKFLQHARAGRIRRVMHRWSVNELIRAGRSLVGIQVDEHGLTNLTSTTTRRRWKWDWAVNNGFAIARRLERGPGLTYQGKVWQLDLTELGVFTLNAATGRV